MEVGEGGLEAFSHPKGGHMLEKFENCCPKETSSDLGQARTYS